MPMPPQALHGIPVAFRLRVSAEIFGRCRERVVRRASHHLGERLVDEPGGENDCTAKWTSEHAKGEFSVSVFPTNGYVLDPSGPKPRVNTCGIGAMRSISSIGISPRSELVPMMNIKTTMGAATSVARVMLFTGSRVSPA